MYRRAWLATGSAILAGITIAIVQNKVIPCVTALQNDFTLSLTSLGWLSSIFCIMSILVAFPAAIITEKLGVKLTCILSLVCTIIGSVFGIMASSVSMLMFSRVIEGAGAGLISIAVPSIISMWFPPEKRGLPTGLWSSWQFVAQALCFFFGVGMSEYLGWRGVWFSGILIAVIPLLLCFLFLSEAPNHKKQNQDSKSNKFSLRDSLSSSSSWMASGAMFCFCFSCFGFVNWAAACWNSQFSIELEIANQYVSLFAIISLPIVILAGVLMDHLNHIKFGIFISFGYIFAVAAAFLLPSAKWILPFVIIYPIFEGGVSTCLWTIIPQTAKKAEHISMAVALFTLASNAGTMIGPPVVGALIESTNSWTMGAVPVAISMVLGTFLISRIKLYHTESEL